MNIIEQIKAEIERRLLEKDHGFEDGEAEYGYNTCLKDMRCFLSSIESEKPMNQEELEEEIVRFEDWMETYNQVDYPTSFTTRDIARHFAEWGAEHAPLPEDTVLFNKGVEEGKRLMMEDAVKWLVDDDYHEASEKGRFILGSVGLGYNGYYIPYSDLLKLPKED